MKTINLNVKIAREIRTQVLNLWSNVAMGLQYLKVRFWFPNPFNHTNLDPIVRKIVNFNIKIIRDLIIELAMEGHFAKIYIRTDLSAI